MFCPFCGNQNRDGKKFCRQCGQTLPPPRARSAETEPSAPPPFREPSAKAAQPGWQPNIAPKTSAGFDPNAEEFEERLNRYAPPLPDTADFQVPKAVPQSPNNGSERSANGVAASLPRRRFETISGPGPMPAPIQQETIAAPVQGESGDSGQAESDEFDSGPIPTDELDTLEKPLDKTDEVPVLASPSPDPVEDKTIEPPLLASSVDTVERGGARVSHPLFSFITSAGSGQGLYLDRALRIERIALAVAIVAAIAGLIIMLWVWVLKPRGLAQSQGSGIRSQGPVRKFDTGPYPLAALNCSGWREINPLERARLLHYESMSGDRDQGSVAC